MKTVMFVLTVLACGFHSSAQRREEAFIMWPTDTKTEKIVFTESVYVPQFDATTLYASAYKFVSRTFKGEKDTIVRNDTTKTITCRSSFFIPLEELGDRGKGFVRFTFSIWCHKNSYKYMMTDFEHVALNPDGVIGGPLENEKAVSGAMLFPRRYWNEQKAKCYYRIQTTIEQFKEAMSAKAEG
jgi:hypothetical protein